ncbi:MAG: DUF72 domain-containing protein [Weeksellaceae bacterium]
MKFGKVEDITGIDFSLPPDHEDTVRVIQQNKYQKLPDVYVGCTNWSRQKLKNFYPRGTKDELSYYATQFNAIEFNAAFYRIFPTHQYETWSSKVTSGFKFFPKIYQGISHWKRLNNAEHYVEENVNAILRLEDHLEMPFIQMPENFAPKEENRAILRNFIQNTWPQNFPLAFEFRHQGWYGYSEIAEDLYQLLEESNLTHVITDTAGRRDLLHMRLTTSAAFIRYVGSNDKIMDYKRVDYWVERITQWATLGIKKIYFFVHQHKEEESIQIAKYFINQLNDAIGTQIKAPKLKDEL